MVKIDELDLKLIKHLQRDGRRSFREIAEELNVAEGTVYNRVTKLKEQGVIRNFMVDIDYSKLGYDLTVVIGVIGRGGHLPEIEKKIAIERNVSAVYDVTGEYDAILIAKLPDRDALNKLVKKINGLEHVERTYTMVVLNVMKEVHGVDLDDAKTG
jgi:Lrp/AsnC family transcriptional regulator, regulator for asnA, asnC and gidA